MKIEKAISRVVLLLDSPTVGLSAVDRASLALVMKSFLDARKIASETYCTCNSARRFDTIAREVLEVLQVKEPVSPLPVKLRGQHCPVHSPPLVKRRLRRLQKS